MMDFDRSAVAWMASPGLTDYLFAVAAMEERARAIRLGLAPEAVWLLEHPPLYTAGTGARAPDLKDPGRLPVFKTGRGGQYTYHGPGQRVAYVMLDVQRRFGTDVRAFVAALERWIIDTLATLGIVGEVREGRVGVWVVTDRDEMPERKIAAIGIRISRGVSYHGISLNIAPDLAHYGGIVPCGIADHGVTSLADLGRPTSTKDVDMLLREAFERLFGPTAAASPPLAEPLATP
jgi:lipoyl(octanoyl) transferase